MTKKSIRALMKKERKEEGKKGEGSHEHEHEHEHEQTTTFSTYFGWLGSRADE